MLQGTIDILIFSDNKDTLSIYEQGLARGTTFLHFAKKDETGFIKLGNHNFDLIIVDISQPLVSEITFIEKLYSLNTSIPIVIVSEYFVETKDMVFGNKVSEYITKPLTAEKLHDSVKESLSLQKTDEEEKNTEDNLVEHKRKLSVLFEISKYLNSINDFDKLLSTIIKLATDAFNSERATLFVYDKHNKELWSKVGIGIQSKEIRFPVSQGIAGETALYGNAIITDNPYGHPKFNSSIDAKTGFITRNVMSVPLKNLKGEVVGVFQVLNKHEGRFTKEDQLFLNAISATIAIALENTLLINDNSNKISEIQKLYNDLYVAQKMIVWESKHATISELRGFIRDLRKYETITDSINDLKEVIGNDILKLGMLDRIKSNYDKIFSRLGNHMNEMMNQLESESKKE